MERVANVVKKPHPDLTRFSCTPFHRGLYKGMPSTRPPAGPARPKDCAEVMAEGVQIQPGT